MVGTELVDIEAQQKEQIQQMFNDPEMRAQFNANAAKVIESNMKKLNLKVNKSNLSEVIGGIAVTSARLTQAVQMARIEKEIDKKLKTEIKKELKSNISANAKAIDKIINAETQIAVKKMKDKIAKEERRLAEQERRLAEQEQNKIDLHFYANIGLVIVVSILISLLFWSFSNNT